MFRNCRPILLGCRAPDLSGAFAGMALSDTAGGLLVLASWSSGFLSRADAPRPAGGLGFVQKLPGAFALVPFAVSAVIASHWAHEIGAHRLKLVGAVL